MRRRSASYLVASLALAPLLQSAGASAQSPLLPGKQIRLVVGSGAGGAVDVYARILASHLADHLPGHPTFVIEDMPGAIGLAALNWLASSAPRDGTAMVASTNVALAAPLFGNKAARYDPRTLTAIGNVARQQSICATWHTSATKTLDDAKRRTTIMGAGPAASRSATIPDLFNKEIGTQFKIVRGYSPMDLGVAIERGEVDGACNSWPTLKAAHPDWIVNHRLNVLIQTGDSPHPDLPDVALLTSLVSDPQTKQMLRLLELPDELGRPYVMPPDSPADKVTAMRAAFDTTMRDEAFLADARKAMLEVDPMSGDGMARRINEAYATPKDIVSRALPYSGSPE